MVNVELIIFFEVILTILAISIVTFISKRILESSSYILNATLLLPQAIGIYVGLSYIGAWGNPFVKNVSILVILSMFGVSLIKTTILRLSGENKTKKTL